MARIRTIKPEFFRHHELWSAERDSGLPLRLAYAGLWCVVDRAGRFKWRPAELKIQILPYDEVDFARVLEALVQYGFVRRYTVDGVAYGVVPSFTRHQVFNVKEKASTLPGPAQDEPCADTVPEPWGKEGKGKEGEGIPTESAASDSATVVFNQGLDWLRRVCGRTEAQCRALLGKWRRDHGDAELIAALGRAQREGPIEPVQWIEAALRHAARPAGPAAGGFNL